MTTTDATYRKEIVFDRESRDYAMRLDGELVGYARTYHEAEVTLDQLVFELLSHGATATATQLDGDSDADECAADVNALVIRGDEPSQHSACVAEPRAPICETCNGERRIPAGGWGDQAGGWAETCPDCGGQAARQRCLLCGGDHSAENCPRIHPIDATALLHEADAVIGRLYCPLCLGNHLLRDCPLKHGDHATAETTDMQSLLAFARDRGACAEARRWLNTQTDPHVAWEMCERPDWMIWYARQRGVERKVLVRIACDCARTALRFVPEGEDRPRLAIEAAERWTQDEATIDEVRVAAYAAYVAAEAAYVAYVAADAYAAYAAYAAANAAYVAADADAAAADAVAAYAAADARKQANIQVCQIIRTHLRYEDVAL